MLHVLTCIPYLLWSQLKRPIMRQISKMMKIFSFLQNSKLKFHISDWPSKSSRKEEKKIKNCLRKRSKQFSILGNIFRKQLSSSSWLSFRLNLIMSNENVNSDWSESKFTSKIKAEQFKSEWIFCLSQENHKTSTRGKRRHKQLKVVK